MLNIEQANCITLTNMGQRETFPLYYHCRAWLPLSCPQDNLPTEEEYTDSRGQDSEEEAGHLVPRILYDNSAESEQGHFTLILNDWVWLSLSLDNSDLDNISEPEEVKRAWEELVIIQREQQR